MAYLGLARKWRPKSFEDLVGQAHIARTLVNAIKAGRIHPGYLFTGTRGIGKTSASRIFAKALRCSKTTEPGVPCNICPDCLEITEGKSVDVLEIDGASNNGVDAVREIRENAKYLPSSGKYKIYIIDEVHMLTTAAFNALLKTLEEPPPHVLFIFATTDPQKIPETVLSRCQRFDFKRVSQKELEAHLKKICATENITIDAEALNTLAREAEGSMRDAISLLDQVLAVGEGTITARTIASALGLVDRQTTLDCVTGILKREALPALEAVGKVYLHGFDLKQFGREILRTLRQVMVARLLEKHSAGDISAHLDISDTELRDLQALTQSRSLDDLDMLFRLLNHGLEDVARSSIPKMVMDTLIIKMASAEELVSVSEMDAPPEPASGSGSRQASVATPARPEQLQAAPAAAPAAPRAAAPPEAPAPATSPAAPSGNSWRGAVEFIRAQKPLIASILENMGVDAVRTESTPAVVTLIHSKDHSFYRDQLQSKAYSDALLQLLKSYFGRPVRVEFKEASDTKSISEIDEEARLNEAEERKRAVLGDEVMKATQQLLGAKLEKFELRGDRKS